jgi:S-adenosylmethionine:tRNA ribosyltransferase-isomerase
MRTADFDYDLPADLIAQQPASRRDESRLLVLHRSDGSIEHRRIPHLLEYLKSGDVLVLNNSRVIPARLRGINAKTSGQFEILLLEENATNDWWVMLRPGKRARVGTEIRILKSRRGKSGKAETGLVASVIATNEEGHRRLRFSGVADVLTVLDEIGEVPLPPYIQRIGTWDNRSLAQSDHERYQTVFAGPAGSVAAPTAGLHFTDALLDQIRSLGVDVVFVTLHVGLATFAPVKAEVIEHHNMHEERFEISEAAARAVNEAKAQGRRVVAVGTTSVRVLESAADISTQGTRVVRIKPGSSRTHIFIYPPYQFRIVDALLTNFHLPRSTLLMLVSAFASPGELGGRQTVLSAYAEAIRKRYRFYSYGDAMLVV